MIKDQILELASKLPPEDLRELARRFNEAADRAAPDANRAAVERKIAERLKAYDEGRTKMLSLDEFLERRQEKLRARIQQASQD